MRRMKGILKKSLKGFLPSWTRRFLKGSYLKLKKSRRFNLISTTSPLREMNSPRYIVSLTSYGTRLKETAPYAIASLFTQTFSPDRIILWVAHQDRKNLPRIMGRLVKKGLEIRFCDDIKSYKKLIPTLKEFPDDYIITADDDVYYAENWLGELVETHKKNPGKIICHRAHEIKVDANHLPLPYKRWGFCANAATKSSFPTGVGGVLYPPNCFHADILNEKLFTRLAPKADDIWFWAMAVINDGYFEGGDPYVTVVDGCFKKLDHVDFTQQLSGNALYNYNLTQNGNDKQLQAVIAQYPQIKEVLKKIEPTVFTVPISVIVPVFNAGKWLERCFKSLEKQSYPAEKIEVLFVDDCSSDNSVQLLESLIGNYIGKIRFKLLRQSKNSGMGRDIGIKNASGEYVFIMDADDEITENALAALAELAQKYPGVDVVQGNTIRIESVSGGKLIVNPTWDISRYNFPEFVNNRLWIKERLAIWIRKDGYIPHSLWNKLIRRNFVTDNNLYFGKIQVAEDQFWHFRASKKIQSIAFSHYNSYIYHREHLSVVSQVFDKEKIVVPTLEFCENVLKDLDEEVAYWQLNLIRTLLDEAVRKNFDKNKELKRNYFQRFQSVKESIDNLSIKYNVANIL